jgi:hypothetical protein
VHCLACAGGRPTRREQGCAVPLSDLNSPPLVRSPAPSHAGVRLRQHCHRARLILTWRLPLVPVGRDVPLSARRRERGYPCGDSKDRRGAGSRYPSTTPPPAVAVRGAGWAPGTCRSPWAVDQVSSVPDRGDFCNSKPGPAPGRVAGVATAGPCWKAGAGQAYRVRVHAASGAGQACRRCCAASGLGAVRKACR